MGLPHCRVRLPYGMNPPKNQFHSRHEPIWVLTPGISEGTWTCWFISLGRGGLATWPRSGAGNLELRRAQTFWVGQVGVCEPSDLIVSLWNRGAALLVATGRLEYCEHPWAVISPDFFVFLAGGLKFKHYDLRWVGRAGKSNVLEKQTTTKVLFLNDNLWSFFQNTTGPLVRPAIQKWCWSWYGMKRDGLGLNWAPQQMPTRIILQMPFFLGLIITVW